MDDDPVKARIRVGLVEDSAAFMAVYAREKGNLSESTLSSSRKRRQVRATVTFHSNSAPCENFLLDPRVLPATNRFCVDLRGQFDESVDKSIFTMF